MLCESPIKLYGVSDIVEPRVEYAWLSSTADKSTYVCGYFSFSGTGASLRCLLVLFFMICRVMKKFIKRLIANIVERPVMIATPVVVSLFSKRINCKLYSIFSWCMPNVLGKRKEFIIFFHYLLSLSNSGALSLAVKNDHVNEKENKNIIYTVSSYTVFHIVKWSWKQRI